MTDQSTPEPEPRSREGFVLLLLYTLVGVLALPFSVVLALFTPMIVGGENHPNDPAVVPFMLLLFGTPLLILVGIVGGWVSWFRRRGRAALIYALLPVVYGALAIVALSLLG